MPRFATSGVWSSGMIPASGAGGPGFNSRSGPYFFENRVKILKFINNGIINQYVV